MSTLYFLQFLSSGDVGDQGPRKNSGSHIDASHSRQPLVKGERLVRYEVNAVMIFRVHAQMHSESPLCLLYFFNHFRNHHVSLLMRADWFVGPKPA